MAFAAALVSTGVSAPSATAAVDDATVGTIRELQSVANACTGTGADPTVVTISGAISDANAEVVLGCHAVLDLAGHDVAVRNIIINNTQALTVTDTGTDGTLTADATPADYIAGIQNTAATLTIQGGTVNATGGGYGAGIGGGYYDGGGGTTTINAGTVNATGGYQGAGIGGGVSGDGGTTTVSGGEVNATGGDYGAGIGGGYSYGGGGTTTINAGTVTATGGLGGAGIGSGYYYGGGGGTTTINGGTVNATGYYGAGIGGGYYFGDGGTTTITAGTVTVTGSFGAAGIGGGHLGNGGVVSVEGGSVTATGSYSAVGAGESGTSFGSLAVDGGVLRLPSGDLRVPDSAAGAEITVGPNGVVDGSAGPGATYATMTGGGQIANGGRILLPTGNVTGSGVTVFDRHYVVGFDTQGGSTAPGSVTVFADTFDHGGRVFPADPTKTGLNFTGWNTVADGSGDPVTGTSILAGSSAGTPVALTAYAQWASAPVITGAVPSSGTTAGGAVVVITGTGFNGATRVRFGINWDATSFTVDSDTQITATSPASAIPATRNIRVNTPAGISPVVPAGEFTYIAPAPTITGVTPSSGPMSGGTEVVITGTGFTGATKVAFGINGPVAPSFTVDSPTQITAVTPSVDVAGVRNIRIITPRRRSAVVAADQFTYTSPSP